MLMMFLQDRVSALMFSIILGIILEKIPIFPLVAGRSVVPCIHVCMLACP